MIYGSVCSGIEAATVAWHSLGWKPAFFSEIEPFPREVLSHHYPEVPLHGDFTTIETNQYGTIDLLVGGTPCQSFSIAGLRKGLDDDRGNLALEFLKLAQRERPKWLVWENVPGVLSSNGGRDFGTFLGGLGELGYGFAYRVLDAQYFGVAQRRRRVFVVGYLGDWRRAAAVLFERESLSGNPAPSRQKGQGAAKTLASSTGGGGANVNRDLVTTGSLCARTGRSMSLQDAQQGHLIGEFGWPADIAATMNARFADKMGLEDQHALGGASHFVPDVMGTITARMFNALGARDVEEGAVISFPSNANADAMGATGNNVSPTMQGQGDAPAVVYAFKPGQSASAGSLGAHEEIACTLEAGGGGNNRQAVAFAENQRAELRESHITQSLSGSGGKPGQGYQAVRQGMTVRRLTPVECERLQGFPDNFTRIPYRNKPADNCPDGPRYKALGNSMAVPVMHWIGRRIEQVDKL